MMLNTLVEYFKGIGGVPEEHIFYATATSPFTKFEIKQEFKSYQKMKELVEAEMAKPAPVVKKPAPKAPAPKAAPKED